MSAQEQTFDKPHDVDDVTLAFPANIAHLMPHYSDIPGEFKRGRNPYVRFQQKWFFTGLGQMDVPSAKDGVDQQKALRHLAAIQQSFEPKHEHKEAAVAYLASLWLETPNVD